LETAGGSFFLQTSPDRYYNLDNKMHL
jgi:hypothetical protein